MCITKSWPWCVHRLIFKVHEDRERLSVCEETFFLESTKNKRLIKGSARRPAQGSGWASMQVVAQKLITSSGSRAAWWSPARTASSFRLVLRITVRLIRSPLWEPPRKVGLLAESEWRSNGPPIGGLKILKLDHLPNFDFRVRSSWWVLFYYDYRIR